jgi:hypothetical protein
MSGDEKENVVVSQSDYATSKEFREACIKLLLAGKKVSFEMIATPEEMTKLGFKLPS